MIRWWLGVGSKLLVQYNILTVSIQIVSAQLNALSQSECTGVSSKTITSSLEGPAVPPSNPDPFKGNDWGILSIVIW